MRCAMCFRNPQQNNLGVRKYLPGKETFMLRPEGQIGIFQKNRRGEKFPRQMGQYIQKLKARERTVSSRN